MSGLAELPGFELPPSAAVEAIDSMLAQTFTQRARDFVLTHLRRNGSTSGEDLTDSMIQAGIRPPTGDDRNFGSVYRVMHREDLIEEYGVATRRKGNGTLGARIWRITAKGLKS